MSDQEGFRVIDKRASSKSEGASAAEESKKQAAKEAPPKEDTQGPGFVMQDSTEADASQYHVDFPTLILSFATSAMMALGHSPDPALPAGEVNLDLARQNIDILSILQEKTKGNLTPEESQMIEQVIRELRMAYVAVQRAKP